MKFTTLFALVSLFAISACETTNVYPTKTVEVGVPVNTTTTVKEVVTVEKTITKIDCKSIDGSFMQVGDTCVSMCVACTKGGGQCLDTNGNGYGDTCVAPLPAELTPAVAPHCMDYDDDGFVECSVGCQLSTNKKCGDCSNFDATVHPGAQELCNGKDDNCDGVTDEGCDPIFAECYKLHGEKIGKGCSGKFGVCAENGVLECSDQYFPGVQCSTDVGGSQDLSSPEICGDNIDNNCDGVTDEGCDPFMADVDNDGYPAFGDCDDNDASIHPGLPNCPSVVADKMSYKLVLVWGAGNNTPFQSGLYYKVASDAKDLSFSSKVVFDKSWTDQSFAPKSFVAIDLPKVEKQTIAFNAMEYPGMWTICDGSVIDKIDLNLTLPKVYLVTSGIWTDVTDKVVKVEADDVEMIPSPIPYGGTGFGGPAKCAALLKL